MAYFIGLDLGGTNIKAGVVDDKAKVLSKLSHPTRAEGGPTAVMEELGKAAHEAAKLAGMSMEKIDRIGVGSPGPLDIRNGLVLAAPNMPGWKNVPLRDGVAQRTGRPAVLENDANAAAFGEFWAGAGRDPHIRHVVMLTLGTGVGSGIIIDGKLLHGAFDIGAEAGHMIVVPDGRLCGCGQHGCIEQYASASAVGRIAAERIAQDEGSILYKTFKGSPGKITAKDVFDAAKAGDRLATKLVDETATYLGIACVNLCRILDPQMIVFAGGMILAGDFLFNRVRSAFEKHTWKAVETKAQIVTAQLGNDAGFIGAAAVAWDAQQSHNR